ncbi:Uncharacterised protein [Candidatus Norongarragalina meridionalis]|nr:Uncharacterised protein [Candidatus Norongarragalina meridionalis]
MARKLLFLLFILPFACADILYTGATTNQITVTRNTTLGTTGSPYNFTDLYSFDLSTPYTILTNTTCGSVGNVSVALRPADTRCLQPLLTIWNSALCTAATWNVTGKDINGTTVYESIAINTLGTQTRTGVCFAEITNVTVAPTGTCICEMNQSRLGAIWRLDSSATRKTFQFDANLQIGNGTSTSASYLNDTNVVVTFNTNMDLLVQGYGYFTLGLYNNTNDFAYGGGSIQMAHTTAQQFLVYGNGGVFWYDVDWTDAGTTSYCYMYAGSIIRMYYVRKRDTTPTSTADDQCPRLFTTNVDLRHFSITGAASGIELDANESTYNWRDIQLYNINTFPLVNYLGNIVEVTNLLFNGSANMGRQILDNNEFNCTNCDGFDYRKWTCQSQTTGNSIVREKYTFNVTTQYPNGTAISAAVCTLYDVNGTEAWSNHADANGNMYNSGTITGWRNCTANYTLTPMNLYCYAPGLAAYNATYQSIKKAVEFTVGMQPQAAGRSNNFLNRETRVANGTTLLIRAQFSSGDSPNLTVRGPDGSRIWTDAFPASNVSDNAARGLFEREIQFNCSANGYGDWSLMANTTGSSDFITITCDHYSIDNTYLLANETANNTRIILDELRANMTNVLSYLVGINYTTNISNVSIYNLAYGINQTTYWHYLAFNLTTFGASNLTASEVWNYAAGRNTTWFNYDLARTYVWNNTDRNLTYWGWLSDAGNYVWNHTSAVQLNSTLNQTNATVTQINNTLAAGGGLTAAQNQTLYAIHNVTAEINSTNYQILLELYDLQTKIPQLIAGGGVRYGGGGGGSPWSYSDMKTVMDTVAEVKARLPATLGSSLTSLLADAEQNSNDTKRAINLLLAAKELIGVNTAILQRSPYGIVEASYYTYGSIVLNVVLMNPLNATRTTVWKQYLPPEVTTKDIMSTDGLDVGYDPSSSTLFVYLNATLGPGESITRSVEMVDIWNIPPEEIQNYSKNLDDLAAALANTPYAAQAVTLKTDAQLRLNKILIRQKQAITPDQHLQVYAENKAELEAALSEMDELQKLVGANASEAGLGQGIATSTLLTILGAVAILAAFAAAIYALRRRQTTPRAAAVPAEMRELLLEMKHKRAADESAKISERTESEVTRTVLWEVRRRGFSGEDIVRAKEIIREIFDSL